MSFLIFWVIISDLFTLNFLRHKTIKKEKIGNYSLINVSSKKSDKFYSDNLFLSTDNVHKLY